HVRSMTEPDQSQPSEQDKPVLDYAKQAPGDIRRKLLVCGSGVVVAIPAVLFLGCGVFNAGDYHIGGVPPNPQPQHVWPIASFAALAIAAAIGLYFAFTAENRRWFVIGLLLGTGIMALIEGACFLNP